MSTTSINITREDPRGPEYGWSRITGYPIPVERGFITGKVWVMDSNGGERGTGKLVLVGEGRIRIDPLFEIYF